MSSRPAHAAVLAACIAAAAPLAAQQPQRPDSAARDSVRDAARRLAPVVVTATRAPAPADEVPQRVVTITRAEIERTPVNDAVDALKKIAGLDVVQYPGILGGVGIRGFQPTEGTLQQTVLLLIDGRPSGVYNLSTVDLSNVERIEVLKGPASALYGSSAMGGVVNFITRASHGAPNGAVSAAYGTFAQSELTGRAGGVLARPGGYAIDADVAGRRYEEAQNYRIGGDGLFRSLVGGTDATKVYTGTSTPSRTVGDTAGNGLVRDFTTYTTGSGSARVGVALPGAMRVDVRGELFRADNVLTPGDLYAIGSDYTGDGRKNTRRGTQDVTIGRDLRAFAADTGAAGLTQAPTLRLYNARERAEYYDTPTGPRFIDYTGTTATTGLQLQDVLRYAGQSLTAGFDASRADASSQSFAQTDGVTSQVGTYSPDSRLSSAAGFAEARLRSPGGRVTGTLGGRLDRITLDVRATPFRPDVTPGTDHFTVFNPSAGLQAEVGGGLRAHATAGRAFVAPDAFGTAGYAFTTSPTGAEITVGNPNLRPEHSVTVDGGLSYALPARALDLDVTYFHTDVTDRITTAFAAFPAGAGPTTAAGDRIASIQTAANAGRARIRGLEATVRYDLGRALGNAYSLAFFAGGTRYFRAEETTPTVAVDTAGLSAVQHLDTRAVFSRIVLGPASTTTRIRNVANLAATAGAEYAGAGPFSARLAGRYVGRRFDYDFSNFNDVSDILYPAFLVVDLTAGVRLRERYRVEALVDNLTNENYYEKRGYNLPGRAVRVRVTAGF
ncbi:TonB-dependent receptor [Gemmatimonadetes bacterium T265]|nr:TonB-dependent receptor [Gemmatimonadetes bacterium T265]